MRPLLPQPGVARESGAPSALPQRHGASFLTPGNSAAYRDEDANEDTIGVLVRLITEKKGEGRRDHPCAQEGGTACDAVSGGRSHQALRFPSGPLEPAGPSDQRG